MASNLHFRTIKTDHNMWEGGSESLIKRKSPEASHHLANHSTWENG
jgi:hypothetical protein